MDGGQLRQWRTALLVKASPSGTLSTSLIWSSASTLLDHEREPVSQISEID